MRYRLVGVILASFSLVGFSTGELVELSQDINARWSPKFVKRIHNHLFKLPKGTVGEIQEVVNFKKTGNLGLKLRVRNGTRAGDVVWVYYNTRNPAMRVLDTPPKETGIVSEPQPISAEPLAQQPKPEKGKGVITTREVPAFEDPTEKSKQEPESPEIKTSNVDLPSAIACYHSISAATGTTPETNYPEGFVALPGQDARQRTGAFLYQKNGVRFFKGLHPNDGGHFFEFIGTSPEYFSVSLNQGEEVQSPEIRGRLAEELRGILENTKSLAKAAATHPPKAAAEPSDPLTSQDEQEIKKVLQSTEMSLLTPNGPQALGEQKLIEDETHPNTYRIAVPGRRVHTRIEHGRITQTIIVPPGEEALPQATALKAPDVIQALGKCRDVRDEPRVSSLAARIQEELANASRQPVTPKEQSGSKGAEAGN